MIHSCGWICLTNLVKQSLEQRALGRPYSDLFIALFYALNWLGKFRAIWIKSSLLAIGRNNTGKCYEECYSASVILASQQEHDWDVEIFPDPSYLVLQSRRNGCCFTLLPSSPFPPPSPCWLKVCKLHFQESLIRCSYMKLKHLILTPLIANRQLTASSLQREFYLRKS